jgi:copper transport protein
MNRRFERIVTRSLAVAALVAGGWLILLAPTAAAHAKLVASDPVADSRVAVTPSRVLLTFSEAVDPKLSIVRIVDAHAAPVVGAGAVQAAPGDPKQLLVPLSQPLPRGVYSVNWRSVSSDDGHVETGVFAFGIGLQTAVSPGSAVTVSLQHTSRWLSAWAAVGRWLLYWGLALIVGAAGVSWLVFAGTVPPGGTALLRGAMVAAVAGLCVMTVAERLAVGAPSLLPLFLTPEGGALLAQGYALVLCGVAVAALDLWPRRWAIALLGAAGALAMLAHVRAGHADALASLRPLNVTEQWVHMVAIGLWIGGLAWLLLGLRGRESAERGIAVRAYSRLATWALVVVLASGVLRAVSEVGSIGDLVNTRYGVVLLVKIGLVVVLVALGAINHFRLVPVLGESDGAVRPFWRNTRGEIVVAAVILAVTAALAGLAPAAPPRGSTQSAAAVVRRVTTPGTFAAGAGLPGVAGVDRAAGPAPPRRSSLLP